MLEVQIDRTELDRLAEKLERSPQVLRKTKKQAIADAAPKLLSALRTEIGGNGRVQGWQGSFVGSGGGYAAVRPKAETYVATKGKQRYAVGYVTNAVNSGHRYPSNKLGYRSRAGKVPGKQFYQRAQVQADAAAREAREQVIQALKNHLGE